MFNSDRELREASERLEEESLEIKKTGYSPPKLSFSGWILFAFITVILALCIEIVLVQTFKIPSLSMYPTLEVGDYIVVNKVAYGLKLPLFDVFLGEKKDPKLYDVVVFRSNDSDGKYYIKRVVGLPGDIVKVRDYITYINDKRVSEFAKAKVTNEAINYDSRLKEYGPITLESGEFFVLGDNRFNSEDSRVLGPIKRNSIIGKAIRVYWSCARVDGNWEINIGRIGMSIK